MPNLLSLPVELLCQIADHVGSLDLIDMRLACKPLRDAANKPFGIAYFTKRRHVLTQNSIEALLEIVTHPAVGPYVNSISMTAAIPVPHSATKVEAAQFVAECLPSAFVNSRSYMQLMKQVFTKVLGHQNSVHISICDPTHHLSPSWVDMIGDPPLDSSPCHPATLDNTLLAAIRANCHVRTLELSMVYYKFDELYDTLEDLFSPTRPPLKLIIDCHRRRTRILQCPYKITYDQADQSLELDGCDVYELARAKEGSSIKKLFGFLLAQTTQLILENCHLCSERSFAAFLALDDTNTLAQNLTSNFRPCRSISGIARGHWSGILSVLSEFADLKYFVMQDLRYASEWELFHLPRTTKKHEISGEDVAEQLRVMAALVATVPARPVLHYNLSSEEDSSDEEH
ncbi:hypothetical protein E4T50_04187 [Aureobasidium sp. EXF-12298]|nr:hypothetical protein E4T50_04187 [Aureobasidium sp. EXF-12298]